MKKSLIVIGGGAAGFFGAINFAEKFPGSEVTILEKSPKVLRKVKISGGGRCNVTNVCSDPRELSKNYPRGGKALIGAFTRFSSNDTVRWFEDRGIKLKVEEDGRIFPVSDDSQTIIDCLISSAEKAGVKILTNINVVEIIPPNFDKKWKIKISDNEIMESDNLLIAPGSSERIWEMLKNIGHKIVPPIPSLFTFNIKDERLKDIPGISVNDVEISVEGTKLKSNGPLLVTHWGLSGPAILKLSAWGARILNEKNYSFFIKINFIPSLNHQKIAEKFLENKITLAKKRISSSPPKDIPLRLWEKLLSASNLTTEIKWQEISKKNINILIEQLIQAQFSVEGKSTFKEEFVTCGGVSLDEVDFKTMQSKLFPGLYFAGEILDIDGITGGFNFQSAWTTGWIAGNSM
jgi:predicted Rossmann fold flavoprotein